MVRWLDIGFQSVELEPAKSMIEHKQHAFVHQPLARIRQEAVVPKKRILEGSTNEIIQVDDANDVAGLTVNDEKASMGLR